jgi:hypothetical protein
MSITYQLKQEDFLGAFTAHRNSKPVAKWARRFLIAIPGLFFAISILVVLAGRPDDPQSIVPPLVIFAIWGTVLWGLPRWAARKQFMGQRAAQGPITLTLDETGVHTRWNGGNSDVEWRNFVRWVEGKNQILLYSSPVLFNIVPKRALSPEELNVVRELVQQHVRIEKGV